MTAPVIPIEFGSHILPGTIVNYENPEWANIRVTVWHYGPPPVPLHLFHLWPWPEVHDAHLTGQPLVWF